MCGIAGIIYRNDPGQLGLDMTRMLQSMKHRGPDSTGYALYGPTSPTVLVRYKLADANDPRDFDYLDRLQRHQREVLSRVEDDRRQGHLVRGRDRVRLPAHARASTAT